MRFGAFHAWIAVGTEVATGLGLAVGLLISAGLGLAGGISQLVFFVRPVPTQA